MAVCTMEKANVAINRLQAEGRLGELCCVVVDELHLVGGGGWQWVGGVLWRWVAAAWGSVEGGGAVMARRCIDDAAAAAPDPAAWLCTPAVRVCRWGMRGGARAWR